MATPRPGTVGSLLRQHSTNPIEPSDAPPQPLTIKPWTKAYEPIAKLTVHTRLEGQAVVADFSRAFVQKYDDDALRLRAPAYPPNLRHCLLESAADSADWFSAEVVSAVLAGFCRYPPLFDMSRLPPPEPARGPDGAELADSAYVFEHRGGRQVPLAVGKYKAGGIDAAQWQDGKLRGEQEGLSRELRGYADRYACPQVFCFDGHTLLVLQFRAKERSDIASADCPVDVWVLPRANRHPKSTPFRLAFYRLLAQGFRRVQGLWPAENDFLQGNGPDHREFFSGVPVFRILTRYVTEPWFWKRAVDARRGAFYWVEPPDWEREHDDDGAIIWDTEALWDCEGEGDEGQGAS